MNQQVQKFYEAMKNDDTMMVKAGKINQQFADKKVSDADAVGYNFTKEELDAYSENVKNAGMKALPEDELAAVAGGAGAEVHFGECIRCWPKPHPGSNSHDCFCCVGGYGRHQEPDWTCICVVGGGGGMCSRGLLLVCALAGVIVP